MPDADPADPVAATLTAWSGKIRACVAAGRYKLKSHVLVHSLEEGFEEAHVLQALQAGSIIEAYPAGERCLVCGKIDWSSGVGDHLHVVVDLRSAGRIEIVTAYLPRPPWWASPFRRGG